MTAQNDPAGQPVAQQRRVLGNDHDRGLQFLSATFIDIRSPSAGIIRAVAALPEGTDLTPWRHPNLALRIQLGAAADSPSRVYTVRRISERRRCFEFDVVVHEGPGKMLPWMRRQQVGDSFTFSGPRPHLLVPQRKGAAAALFADASALPAVHALLAQWPDGQTADIWVCCDDHSAVETLPTIAGVRVHLVAEPVVSSETPLLNAARALEHPLQRVVWAAGEREEMRALRRYFSTAIGLAREHVAVAGYWKRGESTTDTDTRRLHSYQRLLAAGGSLADVDDLADDI